MFVCFAAFLAVSDQNYRRSKVTGITHEAARIPDRARNAPEQIQIVFGRKIRQCTKPVWSFAVSEQADCFADVIGACVDVGPKHQRLHFQPRESQQDLFHLLALAAIGGGGRMENDQQKGAVDINRCAAAGRVHQFRADCWNEHPRNIAAWTAYAKNRIGLSPIRTKYSAERFVLGK